MPLPGAAYDIVIGDGLLAGLPSMLEQHCPAAHYAIITDSRVASLYGEPLRDALAARGTVTLAVFPAGESNKNREQWGALTDQLLAAGVGRDGAVVALGGGVVGDLGGFVAATYLRGIPCVQVPTTLLAMIDSSIGGKTGVDSPAGKNLIGAFHQPHLVVADVATLGSLPRNHISAGMAEALKHGAIADRPYFDHLHAARDRLFAHDRGALAEAVVESVRIKGLVVLEDEREQGRRAMLNFGHTVGHAVEAATGYSLLHGEAVAIGMAVETAIGVELGVTDKADAATLVSVLERFGLPTKVPPGTGVGRMLAAMRHDKKARGGEIRFALIARLGEMVRGPGGEWTVPVAPEEVEKMLKTRP